MEGTTIGEWKVLKLVRLPLNNGRTRVYYLCECSCGRQRIRDRNVLLSGQTRRCIDCRRKLRTYDLSNFDAYRSTQFILMGIKARCWYSKSKAYKDYGGRGIKLCERWRLLRNFIADMGLRPKGMQIDRINNDGNYEPGNCRWVTPKVNANNKRKPKTRKKRTKHAQTTNQQLGIPFTGGDAEKCD